MHRIRLQPVSNFILIPIKVIGIDGNNFRDIEVALDTAATTTSIPMYVASALGYNISKPKKIEEVVTGSGVEEVPIIEIKGLTAIGQTIENIEVMCHDLPLEAHVEGVLGLNFLMNFDVNISFSKGIIELTKNARVVGTHQRLY